jgi:hypothetical protein
MLNALVLAMALTGQTQPPNYDLITETAPTLHTSKGSFSDPKISELANARAKVREATRVLNSARKEVSELSQEVAEESRPRARVEYSDGTMSPWVSYAPEVNTTTDPLAIRSYRLPSTAITYQSGAPVTYRMASSPVTYSTTAPMASTSCYSSAYSSSQSVYSSPPVTTVMMSPVTTYMSAAPVTYSAAPMMYSSMPASYGSGMTTMRAKSRMGLFGNMRSSMKATSYGSGGGMFSSFFGAGGHMCVGGT